MALGIFELTVLCVALFATANPSVGGSVRLDDISPNNVWRRGRPCSSDRRFRSLVPVLQSRRWLLSRRARAWQKQRRGPALVILPKSFPETIRATGERVHLTHRGARRH